MRHNKLHENNIKRDLEIFRLRHEEKITLEIIGDKFGLTRQRIGSILGITGRFPGRTKPTKADKLRKKIEKFWSRVDAKDKDSCWEWKAGKYLAGYGNTRWNGKHTYAHRIAWFLTNGEIPEGLCICHKCDNPPCCNPSHLFLCTFADNARDRENKGRGSKGKRIPKHE